jgi:ammonia channel protein AmtB
MTLNGVLAGLVGVTAGCAAVSQWEHFLSDLSVV